ncbi:hypothetical protein [Leptothoe kymatousa]|uniref:DUF481 domain-containing protein n=1 Tax=Leptothoe kymatousa TAU-MAC 1615 TaxID=2364775 RepID=A0ABS5Y3F9_9CYAN|nr:hypothetical protein [Leptothoe kymatousa]MBT9312357.1 hypothetical protein [Leptothoe kymatousa TAU-MAC 1615]
MGLFSRPEWVLKILVIGFGSWVLPQHIAVAQSSNLPSVDAAQSVLDLNSSQVAAASVTGVIAQPKSRYQDDSGAKCHQDTCALRWLTHVASDVVLDSDASEDDCEACESDVEDASEPTTQPNYRGDFEPVIDDELGILRVRSQPVGIDGELGMLRIRTTEDVPLESEPEPTPQHTVFLTARTNLYSGNNLFRTPDAISDRIYQAGIGLFAFPELGPTTNLLFSVEANLARYEELSGVDYDEIQLQAGIRQRLGSKSYGQLNWRYQDLSTPGRDSFFTANYIELLLSRRDILSNRTWADSYYQARLSLSDPDEFSRVSQIATGSLNYGFDPETRASLIYQLFIDDYIETSRYDTYHQILAQLSHDLSSTTRLSVFTGFRFGSSSRSSVDFDDTIYGASINVNLPLF